MPYKGKNDYMFPGYVFLFILFTIAVYKPQIFMPQILKEKFHHFHHNLCPNYKIIVNKILQESKGIHFQNFILQEYAELIL